jgi:hypothetical protein
MAIYPEQFADASPNRVGRDPGYIQGVLKFSNEIEKGVSALPGVRHVSVRCRDVADGSEHD